MIKLKKLLAEITTDQALSYLDDKLDSGVKYNPTDYINQIAEALGETVSGSPLGSGTFGTAYPLSSGRVLKITKDSKEAASAAYLHPHSNTPHLISYYDVRPINPRSENIQYFAIVMDRVTPLPPDQEDWWMGIYLDTRFDDDKIREIMYDSPWITNKGPKFDNFIDNLMSQRTAILNVIRKFNIDTFEVHSDNIGFDSQGRFTIFDIWLKHNENPKSIISSFRKLLKPIDLTPYINKS